MSRWPDDLPALALADLQATVHWPAARWAALVRQGRRAGLLGRVAEQLRSAGRCAEAPAQARSHFEAVLRVCRAQQAEIHREVTFISRAFANSGTPVVLLKGAAYVMAGLPAAAGRVFGDIDILVPKASLADAETRLLQHGWITTVESAYDQRYYRQWMHELPPMQHVHRGTALDVHHTILPETARMRPDPRKLFNRAIALPGPPGIHVLAPEDMVLHSMTHLFVNDDNSYALRDLSDLDLLLRHFGSQSSDFWAVLLARAEELDLTRPLYYGLRHTSRVFGTPINAAVQAQAARHAPRAPVAWLMDDIWSRSLRSPHPEVAAPLAAPALFALYLRGHWLRMPPLMLARHLGVKALGLHKPKEPVPPHPGV